MALDIKVTLRVFSRNHSLSYLNKTIGESSNGFSMGDKYSKGKQVREYSHWAIDSSNIDSRNDFDTHLSEILNFFDKKKKTFLQLKGEECEIDIFCFFSSDNGQGGAKLSAETMSRLTEEKLDLVFDVYAEPDSE